MTERLLTERGIRALLLEKTRMAGGLRKWCGVHRITPSLASAFLNRPTPCPPSLANALGYERQVRYARKVKP